MMIDFRHYTMLAARRVAPIAGFVTFACVAFLVGSFILTAVRSPSEQEYVKTLRQAVKENDSLAPQLKEELEQLTEASLTRQATIDLLTNVLIISSALFLICTKILISFRGRRAPSLVQIEVHRSVHSRKTNRRSPSHQPAGLDVNQCQACQAAPASNGFVDEIIDKLGTKSYSVIPILQAIQSRENFLSDSALQRVCERTDITPAQIIGVSSFYSRFRRSPTGRYLIKVCHGTACHVAGARTISDEIRKNLGIAPDSDTDAQRQFTIEEEACLGCCTLAPVVQIGETTFGHIAPDAVPDMLNDFLESQAAQNHKPAATHVSRAMTNGKVGVPCGEIRIGLGSCCVAGGSEKVFDAITQTVENTMANVAIKRVGCVGMCHQTPLVELVLPGQAPVLYTSVLPEDANAIVKNHFNPTGVTRRIRSAASNAFEYMRNDQLRENYTRFSVNYRDPTVSAFLGRQKHITTEHAANCDPMDIDEYQRHDGFKALMQCTKKLSKKQVLDEIQRSGLRGRGGAGFPSGLKWSKVSEADGDVKYVICNGDEGDPGAFMDRMLMESVPYKIIEGLAIAAYAVGASEGYFYIRAEYPLAVQRIRTALQRCEEKGLLGEDAGLRLQVVEGAGAFVCGEETALIASIEGKRGSPRLRPPFPAQRGLWGKPTLVNNVETLATIPWIIRNGADTFATLGTESSKGTKVFSLAGKIKRGGLIEVPMGVTIREIVYEIGGGIKNDGEFKAVQIGGPSGGCIPASLADTPIEYETLAEVGAIMGSGGLVVLDESDCMVDLAHYFLSFTQSQSCGKCTFCRIGTRRMLDILDRICAGEGAERDLEELERLAENVTDGSLCGLGKTAPTPVRSTLRYFRDEYEAHLHGRCPAGKCKALITYRVTDTCVGCTLCAQHCSANAIAYAPYERHVIDNNKCTCCDICRDKCPENAIEVI